jgi:hypothetical protein
MGLSVLIMMLIGGVTTGAVVNNINANGDTKIEKVKECEQEDTKKKDTLFGFKIGKAEKMRKM